MKKTDILKDSFADKIIILGAVYTIGVILAVLLGLFRVFRRIRILHWKRFPRGQGGLILISNHPSLLEPILLPALFYKDYLLHPLKFSPWSTPDKTNYYDRWYWFWLRPRAIPIDRDNPVKGLRTFTNLKKVIQSGKILILFPERGRTETALSRGQTFLYSQGGEKKIATLSEGIAWLILKTDAPVFFIWVEGTDKFFPNTIWIKGQKSRFPLPRFGGRITIKIGKTVKFEKTNKVDIIQKVAMTLLELGDEEE